MESEETLKFIGLLACCGAIFVCGYLWRRSEDEDTDPPEESEEAHSWYR